MGVFSGQKRHCICTNASRGLSAEILIPRTTFDKVTHLGRAYLYEVTQDTHPFPSLGRCPSVLNFGITCTYARSCSLTLSNLIWYGNTWWSSVFLGVNHAPSQGVGPQRSAPPPKKKGPARA